MATAVSDDMIPECVLLPAIFRLDRDFSRREDSSAVTSIVERTPDRPGLRTLKSSRGYIGPQALRDLGGQRNKGEHTPRLGIAPQAAEIQRP